MSRNLQLQVILNAIDKATGPIKAITDSSSGLGKQLKQTRDQLKTLQSQQADVESFKKLKDASRQSEQAMTAQQQKVKELASRMREVDTPTKAMTKEFQTATREAHRLKDSHKANSQQMQVLRTKLNEAGISTGKAKNGTEKFGIAERELRKRIDETSKSLDNQKNRLQQVTSQQKRLSAAKAQYERTTQLASSMATAGAGGLGVAYGIKNVAQGIASLGINYGAQMSELQAVSRLDKDDERFKMLKQQARELGASTAFSATDVGAGQTFLARAGFSPEAINSSMQDILDLALANGVDLAVTADIASNISGAFKIDPEVEGNMKRVSDVLSGVSARANVDLTMLGDTMKYLGKAEGLGLSLEQSAAMAGVLGNIGIQSSQAGTTMRAMLDRLSAPAAAGAKAMKTLGLEVKDASGNMRNMPDIIAEVAKATSAMGNVDQAKYLKEIFGAEAGSGMAELVAQQGTGALSKLIEELYNVQGENSRMAATRADNIDGDLKGLASAWEEIGIGITDINEGPLRELIQQITGVLRAGGEWAQKNPQIVATIAKFAVVVGLLAGAGGALLLTLGSLLGPLAMMKYALTVLGIKSISLIPAIKGIGTALLFVGKLMMANPIIAAVALLIAAGYMLYENWENVVAGFKLLMTDIATWGRDKLSILAKDWEYITAKISELWNWLWGGITQTLSGIWQEIKTAFSGGINGVSALILNWSPLGIFYRVFAGVMSYFGVDLPSKFSEFGNGIINSLLAGLIAAWASIAGFFSDRFEDLKTAFGGGIAGVSTIIVNWSPLGLFYQVFAGVMDYFGIELPAKFSDFGGMIMQGLISGIKNMAGGVKDAVVGMGDSVGGWFKDKLGIKSPSRVFMQFGGDTAEGLALGIEANKDGPLKQVASMAKQMAAAGAIALSVGVAPAIADNNDISKNLQPASLPVIQDQQQTIIQNLIPTVQPVAHEQQQALPALTQNIQQMIVSAKQVLPDLTQRIIGVFSDPKMAAAGLQQKLAAEQPAITFDTRAPIASPSAARGSTGNITNNYTIHVSGGSDPKALADEVMRQIAAYDRQKQVQQRSRMGDLD